jgi:hypothetical protein
VAAIGYVVRVIIDESNFANRAYQPTSAECHFTWCIYENNARSWNMGNNGHNTLFAEEKARDGIVFVNAACKQGNRQTELAGVFISFDEEESEWLYNEHGSRKAVRTGRGAPGTRSQVDDADLVARLGALTSQETLDCRYTVVGILCAIPLLALHLYVFGAMPIVLGIALAFVPVLKQRSRNKFRMHYDMDELTEWKWTGLNRTLGGLSTAAWIVREPSSNVDFVDQSTGQSVRISRHLPSIVSANIVPYCLAVGDSEFYFLPDRLYITANGVYMAIRYPDVTVHWDEKRVVDTHGDLLHLALADAVVQESEDGERRFIMDDANEHAHFCGVLRLCAGINLDLKLVVSSVETARQFAREFNRHIRRDSIAEDNAQPTFSRGENQSARMNGAVALKAVGNANSVDPRFYSILGIAPNCSKEDAWARYRKLAAAYHPSNISRVAPQFAEAAAKQLAEIERAFDEVSKASGW